MRRHLSNGYEIVRRGAVAIGGGFAREVGAAELVTTAGLALLGRGLWLVSPPAALIICGAVLVWWGLPTRDPFISGGTPPDERTRGGSR